MRVQVWLSAALLAGLGFGIAGAWGATDPPPTPEQAKTASAYTEEPLPADCMPSSQLRPGMKGYGLTVFQGFKPERFEAEILGVQRSAMAHGNMIVARLTGKFLENHGVVAGMSGSPVFIDGKTIGAVAYGWTFAYKPLCGVTPIEQMWKVWQAIGRPGLTRDDEENQDRARLRLPGATQPVDAGGTPATWNWEPGWQQYRDLCEGKVAPLSERLAFRPNLPELADTPGEMAPLAAPLFMTSVSPRVESRLRAFFAAQGMDLMSGGAMQGSASAGEDGREPAPEIEDGSALGVPMVTGDLSLGGIGTVTYRRGNKLVGFGHPMFGRGGVRSPMAAAYIFGFMQSYQRSFKLGETREEVGYLDQDRLYAIGGVFGPHAPRVPVTVSIQGPAAFRPREYRYSVWNDENILPMMAANLTDEAYVSSVSSGGKLTARSEYTLTLSDGRTIHKQFFSSGEGGVMDDALFTMLYDLFLLTSNPFTKAEMAAIHFGCNVEPGQRLDSLVAITPERTQYLAGETVRLNGRFRPYRGDEYQRSFTIRLPERLEPDTYVAHITDASGTMRIRKAHDPAIFNPRSFDDVVRLAQAGAPETDALHVWLFRPRSQVSVNGETLKGLPTSLSNVVQATAPADLQDEPVGELISEQRYPLPAPMEGNVTAMLQIVDHLDQ